MSLDLFDAVIIIPSAPIPADKLETISTGLTPEDRFIALTPFLFAIETFPTTGNGLIYESEECNHFMIEKKNVKNSYNNKYLNKIFQNRSTLAFCPRWFNFEIPDSNYITKYPVLRTKDKSIVAQYEKTIYIKDNGITIFN